MPRRIARVADPGALVAELEPLLKPLADTPPTTPEELRLGMRNAVAVQRGVRQLAVTALSSLITATSGKERVLQYLKLFVKEPIDSEELGIVGGIQEFARRIRELRVQHGYRIVSG